MLFRQTKKYMLGLISFTDVSQVFCSRPITYERRQNKQQQCCCLQVLGKYCIACFSNSLTGKFSALLFDNYALLYHWLVYYVCCGVTRKLMKNVRAKEKLLGKSFQKADSASARKRGTKSEKWAGLRMRIGSVCVRPARTDSGYCFHRQ